MIPLMTKCVRPMDLILFEREKVTSSDRSNIVKLIESRQIQAENGERAPILIFPEGCTTFGTHVIKFKKGAFASLRAVQPFSNKVWYPTVSPNEGGGMNVIKCVALGLGGWFWTSTIIELPVFEPNEYFWQKHWDGKEQKWEAYARVIQKIIAEASGLEMSDCTLEDKNTYKDIIGGKKIKIV